MIPARADRPPPVRVLIGLVAVQCRMEFTPSVRLASLDTKVNLPDLEDCRLVLPNGTRTDIWVIPPTRSGELLGMTAEDHASLWKQQRDYPYCTRGEPIKPSGVQWVSGAHESLEMFRQGNTPLKRIKMFLQDGNPLKNGFRSYKYPYRQWQVVPATADVSDCTAVLPIFKAYNMLMQNIGAKAANHLISTLYADGTDNIGYHSDNTSTIAESDAGGLSLIGIIKTGENARRFSICQKVVSALSDADKKKMNDGQKKAHDKEIEKLQAAQIPFFDEVAELFTIILMTVDANRKSEHAVIPSPSCGPSASHALRTILEVITAAELVKVLQAPEKSDKPKKGQQILQKLLPGIRGLRSGRKSRQGRLLERKLPNGTH